MKPNLPLFLFLTTLLTVHGNPAAVDAPVAAFVFDGAGDAPDRTGGHPPMTLARGTPEPDQPARGVRLDAASLATHAPDLPRTFSVCVWIRPFKLGEKARTQAWPNGMIVTSGSGYYEGWRLTVEDPDRLRVRFEIGQRAGSVSIAAPESLTPFVWHCIAAGWTQTSESDAHPPLGRLWLAINGVRVAESEADRPAPLPPGAPLSVGYADFGVGSLLMDVGSLALYDTALSPDDVVRLFLAGDHEQDLATPVQRATRIGDRIALLPEGTDPTAAWLTIATNTALPALHRIIAAERMRDETRLRQIAEEPDTPVFLKMRHQVDGWSTTACTATQTPPPDPPEETLHIAPAGDDRSGDGSRNAPFSSLERARDEIRRRRGAGHTGGFTVRLAPGRHPRNTPFLLDARDAASAEGPVVYIADSDAVLDGGITIPAADFRPVTDPAILARLPDEARERVRVADLSAHHPLPDGQKPFGIGFPDDGVLMLSDDENNLLQPARWPDTGFITGTADDAANCVVGIPADRARRWETAPALMAHGYWRHTWADAARPVTLTTHNGQPALQLHDHAAYGIGGQPEFYIFNLLEELDQPGEWHYDAAAGSLYLIPPRGRPFSHVVLTRIDAPLIRLHGAHHLTLRGLAFHHARGGGIDIHGAQQVVIAGCDFQNIGGIALNARDCDGLLVRDCVFRNIGHGAMSVEAGDRRTLRAGGVQIHGNTFSRVGQFARTYTPGIRLDGVGGLVCHNTFADMPSSAMRIEGNEHIIESNVFRNVVLESDDQGAIDMWGDPSYRRCIFRYNHFEAIGNPAGTPCGQNAIRFDDAISGMIVHDNVFINASRPGFGAVQIHAGSHNIVFANTFTDCEIGVSVTSWGLDRWRARLNTEEFRDKLFRNVNIAEPPYSTRYPELAGVMDEIDRNIIADNRFENCGRVFEGLPPATEILWNRLLSGGAAEQTTPVSR